MKSAQTSAQTACKTVAHGCTDLTAKLAQTARTLSPPYPPSTSGHKPAPDGAGLCAPDLPQNRDIGGMPRNVSCPYGDFTMIDHDYELERAQQRMRVAKDAFSKVSVGVLWGLASTAEVDAALHELDAARAELQRMREVQQ